MPRLYLTNAAALVTPVDETSQWDDRGNDVTRQLSTSPVGAPATVAGAETSASASWDVLLGTFVSPPLATSGSITAGTQFTWIIGLRESNAAANQFGRSQITIYSGDGQTLRGIVSNGLGQNESTTTLAGVELLTAAGETSPTSTTVNYLAGDRIVVRFGYRSSGTATTPYTGTLAYGGTSGTDLARGDTNMAHPGWIEIDTSLDFAEDVPPVRMYTTNMPSPIPGIFSNLWDQTDGFASGSLDAEPAGPPVRSSIAETTAAPDHDVLLGSWASPPLAEDTRLAGAMSFVRGRMESPSGSLLRSRLVVYVLSSDGTTVRGTAVNTGLTDEWPTAGQAQNINGPLSAVSCLAGDRIVFELGYQADNTTTTPATGTIWYGGTEPPDLAAGGTDFEHPGWIDLPGPLVFDADPQVPPGEILDIGPAEGQQHFEVQISRVGDDEPLIIDMDDVAAGYDEAPYFTGLEAIDAVQLWAPVDGPTTSGSSTARCELREVDEAGDNIAWDASSGEHVMEGITRIAHLPANVPEMVICQAFYEDDSRDMVSIRTQLVSGTIRLRFRFDGVSVTSPQIASPYVVGTEFAWKIRAAGGVWEAYWSFDGPLPDEPQITTTATPAGDYYFKAGAYLQSEPSEDPGDFGAVELRSLTVTHFAPAVEGDLDGTLPALEASLAGVVRAAGSLGGTLPVPTAALTGTAATSGVLSGTLPLPTADLDATTSSPGTLNGTLPLVTAALAGATASTGTLDATLPLPTATLTGTTANPGVLGATLPIPTATLTGTTSAAGVLDGQIPLPTAALGGESSASGTLAGTLPIPTAGLDATVSAAGVLDASLPLPIAALEGDTATAGTLSGTLPVPLANLSGTLRATGELGATLPLPAAALAGDVGGAGVLDGTLPLPTAVLEAETANPGVLDANLPLPTSALAGTVTGTGVLDGTLPLPIALLGGDGSATGVLAATLPFPTADLAGTTANPGELDATLPMPTAALTGTVTQTGTLSGTLPLPTAMLSADGSARGQLDGTLPMPTASLEGTTANPGDLDATLPLPTAALAGTVTQTGTLDGTLPLPTAQLIADGSNTGTLSAALPMPTASLDGDTSNPGVLGASLPLPAVALDGDVATTGVLEGTLPLPTADLGADGGNSGSLNATLPMPGASLAGRITVVAVIHGVLPLVTASLTAGVTASGTLSATLPMPTAALEGTTGDQDAHLDAVLPMPTAALVGASSTTGVLNGVLPMPTASFSTVPPATYQPPLRAGQPVWGVDRLRAGTPELAGGLIGGQPT